MDEERDEIDELVDWQLANKGRPHGYDPRGEWTCPNCGGQWHGAERIDCPGSHVKKEAKSPEPVETIYDMLPQIPYNWGFPV